MRSRRNSQGTGVGPQQSEQPDEWIWGNKRGGGGAPIKDVAGAVVTNLRQVARGSVQVDHSPTNQKKVHHAIEREYSHDSYYDEPREVYHHDRRGDNLPPKQTSPTNHKYSTALRDMNVNPEERDEKVR
jgi:hypothetical protein